MYFNSFTVKYKVGGYPTPTYTGKISIWAENEESARVKAKRLIENSWGYGLTVVITEARMQSLD